MPVYLLVVSVHVFQDTNQGRHFCGCGLRQRQRISENTMPPAPTSAMPASTGARTDAPEDARAAHAKAETRTDPYGRPQRLFCCQYRCPRRPAQTLVRSGYSAVADTCFAICGARSRQSTLSSLTLLQPDLSQATCPVLLAQYPIPLRALIRLPQQARQC
jgi:hypothetical protein